MLLKPFVVITLMLSFSPAARSGDAKDGDTIQGTWLPSTAELGGKMLPDEVRKTIKLVVKDDKYTVTVGKEVDQGTVKLNPAAKPKEMKAGFRAFHQDGVGRCNPPTQLWKQILWETVTGHFSQRWPLLRRDSLSVCFSSSQVRPWWVFHFTAPITSNGTCRSTRRKDGRGALLVLLAFSAWYSSTSESRFSGPRANGHRIRSSFAGMAFECVRQVTVRMSCGPMLK